MSQQVINVGTGPSTGDGETIRSGLIKVNSNFNDAYAHIASTSNPHSVTAAQTGAIPVTELAVANGVATLDTNGFLASSQIPTSVPAAATLTTARLISLAGEVTGSVSFNGSSNVTLTATLAASGVIAGTYTSIVVDATGRVLSGGSAATPPTVLTLSGDVTGTAANGTLVATLAASGATAGTYSNIVVNAKGLVTYAGALSFNNVITALGAVPVLSVSGDASGSISASGVLNLALGASGVGAGTYNSVVVNTKGLVTSASVVSTTFATTLTGDVTGSGTGTFATTLAASGVTAGTYNAVVVNGKGLVTSGTYVPVTGATALSGDVTGTVSNGTIAATLAASGATAGTYASFVIDAKGRVTYAGQLSQSNITTALGYQPVSSLSGDVTGTGVQSSGLLNVALANSGVGAGTYSAFVVNAKGLVTSGLAITATGDATGTASGSSIALTLASSGVTAGTYNSVVVNAKGLVTSATYVAAGAAALTLSGDVTGTGTGTITASLAASGVTAGTYSNIVVNTKGLTTSARALNATDITTALTYTPIGGIQLAGDATGSYSAGTLTAVLAATGVNAGTYGVVGVNLKGLVTYARALGSSDVTGALGYTPIPTTVVLGGDATGSYSGGTITATLAATGVTAGTYNSVVVNAKGLVTSATLVAAMPSALTLTGDVTGSGTGTITATLAASGVTAGTYNSVVVNAKGLVTSATYVAAGSSTITLTGDATGTSSSGTLTATLASVNTSGAGTYNSVVVNAKGLVTSATYTVGTAAPLTLTGDVTGSGTGTITATIAASGVTAGTYNQVVVNAKGLVTSATNVAAAIGTLTLAGDVTGLGANNGTITATLAASGATAGTYTAFVTNAKGLVTSGLALTVTGDATGTASGASIGLTLAASGVTAGTYNSVTVNAKGLVTSASNVVAASGTLTLAGDITGTGANNGTITATLATVNASGAGTYSAIAVNAKGLVLGGANLAATGDVTGTASGNSIALTLASVNTAGTYAGLITDAKGRVTGTATTATLPITTFTGVANLVSYTEVSSSPVVTTGTLTINLATSSLAQFTLANNITSVVVTNPGASGLVSSFVMLITANGSAYTITWPANFKWPGGTAPTSTSTNGKKDCFSFFTVDGGTSYQAIIVGQNF